MKYKGVASFKELLPKNKKEKKEWIKNRLIAYKGSQRHFLKSLCEDRLEEEDFWIMTAELVPFNGTRFFRSSEPRGEITVQVDTILNQSMNSYERKLSFSNYLYVIYRGEIDDIEEKRRRGLPYNQYSCLKIHKGNTITINMKGLVIPGKTYLTAYSYWGWDSADEWLPIHYEPNKKQE